MLPILPFEILFPAAIVAVSIFLFLVLFLIGRRLLIMVRGSRVDHLTQEAEKHLLFCLADGTLSLGFLTWLKYSEIGKARAFVQAVERIEETGVSPGVIHKFLIDKMILDSFKRTVRRSTDKWLRAESAWALGKLGYLEGIPSLEKAIADPAQEVCYVAAQSLAEIDHEKSLKILAREIRKNSHTDNTRLAALIENMECDVVPTIREMLNDPDHEKQFWAIRLIGQKKLFELVNEIKPLISSDAPNIRCACAECIGILKLRLTDRWLEPLIFDEGWFVQVQAAKALGKLKALWAIPDLCELLSSEYWWVRHMASEALVEIGQESCLEVENVILKSEDKFARQTAVKVLERLDWIDNLLSRATGNDPTAKICLLKFVESGGISHLENALHTAPVDTLPIALDFLYSYGDDATYGRIRSALHRMPDSLRESVLQEIKRWRP